MAEKIKGITIKFEGDASGLDKALQSVSKSTRAIDKELREVDRALKFNPKNVELLKQKQDLLKQKISETTDKLELLKQKQADMDAKGVDKNSEEYRKLQREIIETESKLKYFKKQLLEVSNIKLKVLSQQLQDVGKKMQSVGKNMTKYVTGPIAAAGGAAVKTGMDFDKAMSQVAATMGKPISEIQDLRDYAIDMGSTTAFSATQAAEGLNYLALAGYSAEKSMQMLPTILNLAAAGNMELADASDMVTDAQSALGLSTQDTIKMVDEMAKASSTTNTSVSQLGEAFLTVGGTAKMMKGGTQELSQVLGILADNGIKGSEGGTALRNILLSLSAPTDKAAKQLQQLGVNVFDAEGNMRSLQDIMLDLNTAMEGMTSEEKTNAIANMFNKRDLKSVNALLGTTTQRWNEVSSAIGDAQGAAEEMSKTQLDNLAGSLTLLKSALEGAGIAISDQLTPVIRKLAEFITKLVDKFNNLSPTAQKIVVIIAAIVAAIGPLLFIVGSIMTKVGMLLAFLPAIMAVLPAIGAAIAALAVPIGIAIAAIIALIAIIKNWAKIKEFAIKVWNGIKDGIMKVITVLKTNVQKNFDTLKTTVQNAWNRIKTAITQPIQTAYSIVQGVVRKLKNLFPLKGGNVFGKLKLPHFKMLSKGSFPWGIGGKGSLPKWDVSWYKKAMAEPYLFTGASLIGAGEAGDEMLYGRKALLQDIAQAVSGSGGDIVVNVYASENMSVRELADEVSRVLVQTQKRRAQAWA